jgi:hypothetical protein
LAPASPVGHSPVCTAGQKLRDGKLEINNSITSREQAEGDARERCRHDPKIERVAYYAVSEDDRFRNFYTYTNEAAKKDAAADGPRKAKKKSKKPPAKKPLLKRLRSFFEE